jgi:hypothetical protein
MPTIPSPARFAVAAILAAASVAPAVTVATGARAAPAPESLRPVAALPAHVAGTFEEITSCQQSRDGQYFVFDRRAHSVFTIPPGMDAARKLIEVGMEPGRLLSPTAFDLAGDDDTFVVADAPHGVARIQRFLTTGSGLGGFSLPGRAVPRISLRSLVLSGIGSLEYDGKSVFVSQPESGALVTEYSTDGRAVRSFGNLRATGHESSPEVHVALNTGIVVVNPAGGFYFVFLAGVPQYRKYDASGVLLFERHVEGPELDRFIQSLPTTWKRQQTSEGEIPFVQPSIYTAAADERGNLWMSLAVGTTYVYDAAGDRRRAVRFRAAGDIAPTGLSFTRNGRVLVTPGCYSFEARQ